MESSSGRSLPPHRRNITVTPAEWLLHKERKATEEALLLLSTFEYCLDIESCKESVLPKQAFAVQLHSTSMNTESHPEPVIEDFEFLSDILLLEHELNIKLCLIDFSGPAIGLKKTNTTLGECESYDDETVDSIDVEKRRRAGKSATRSCNIDERGKRRCRREKVRHWDNL